MSTSLHEATKKNPKETVVVYTVPDLGNYNCSKFQRNLK